MFTEVWYIAYFCIKLFRSCYCFLIIHHQKHMHIHTPNHHKKPDLGYELNGI